MIYHWLKKQIFYSFLSVELCCTVLYCTDLYILKVHQLDIILGALDDYSTLLREKLHGMLQACTLATKVQISKTT